MTVQKVKPGDTLKIMVRENQWTETSFESWTVIAIYPYHVLAVHGFERQSFTVGELVQMGLEDGHNIKSHGPGSAGQAWRLYRKGKDQIGEAEE